MISARKTSIRVLVCFLGLAATFSGLAGAQTFTDISSRLDYQDGSLHGAWGASFVDVDGNGLPDIYEPGSLYLQQGDGEFINSLPALGIPITKSSVFGSVFADVNDDGFPEMFTIDLNTGRSIYYWNHKGMLLGDSTLSAGLVGLQQAQGTVFADYNGDQKLDMFMGEETGKNQLFFGDGTGKFTEGTSSAGIFTEVRSYGVSAVDFDNDGDMDVFVAACAPLSRQLSINKFFRNNGDGTFEEIGEAAGVNDDLSSWGIVWLDYDRDGDMDTYIANMVEADGRAGFNVLYRNNGDGTFTDVAEQTGTRGEFISFSYGASAADFNNDGWVDLFVSNRSAPPYLLINNGDGTFTNKFSASNIPLITNNTSTSVADLNSDGWLDIFTGGDFLPDGSSATYRGSLLLQNDGGTNGFLTVKLIQEAPNKRGIGARLEVWDDGMVQLRDITAGDGFTSQNMDFSAHFGLGTATAIDSLVIKWPDGTRDRLANVQANQHLYVQKGGTINQPPNPFQTFNIVTSAFAGKAEANFLWEA
ncbi:CRTAC1 family protein [bacterium]|nr:CRTAC1 family protein [bacterium]